MDHFAIFPEAIVGESAGMVTGVPLPQEAMARLGAARIGTLSAGAAARRVNGARRRADVKTRIAAALIFVAGYDV